ncbi:MAG: glycine cleavage system protein H [Candidatus Latescibacterota bacterium]
MVVIGVIAFLVACLVADWILQRRAHLAATGTQQAAPPADPLHLGAPVHAGGFAVQEEMAYHAGHAWAFVEGPGRVRLGVDDFAGRLVGPATGLELPALGEEVQQGVRAWALLRGGRRTPMLAPITGLVVALNPRVQTDPGLVQRDPYGEGWLMIVRPDNLRASLTNLLCGRLVHRWLEEAAGRLRALLHGGSGVALVDGGTAVPDVGALLSDRDWPTVVREFLLTEVPERDR